jgi:hypothetical protein
MLLVFLCQRIRFYSILLYNPCQQLDNDFFAILSCKSGITIWLDASILQLYGFIVKNGMRFVLES